MSDSDFIRGMAKDAKNDGIREIERIQRQLDRLREVLEKGHVPFVTDRSLDSRDLNDALSRFTALSRALEGME